MSAASGPLSDAELDTAARARLPSGIEAPESAFPRELAIWAQEWLRANDESLETAEAKRPFVIVYSETPALDAEEWKIKNAWTLNGRRYLKKAYDIPPAGLMYATANLNEIIGVGDVLKDGSAALECVRPPEFHSRLYAIMFPQQRSIAHHGPGDPTDDFADVDRRQKLGGFSIDNLSTEMLDDLLGLFHKQVVETSSCYAGVSLWMPPFKDRKLVEQAEKVIQGHLATFLCGKFDSSRIHTDWEVYTGGGRADIRLLRWPKTEKQLTAAWLELKVVRNTSSKNEMLTWVEKGIHQAYDYKTTSSTPSDLGFACCFNNHDQGADIHTAAQPLADEKKVYLRFYDIHHLPPHSMGAPAASPASSQS